jgi:hypothetical protein
MIFPRLESPADLVKLLSIFFTKPGDIVMDSFGLSDTKRHSPESPRPIGISAPDVNTEGHQGVLRAHRRACILGTADQHR